MFSLTLVCVGRRQHWNSLRNIFFFQLHLECIAQKSIFPLLDSIVSSMRRQEDFFRVFFNFYFSIFFFFLFSRISLVDFYDNDDDSPDSHTIWHAPRHYTTRKSHRLSGLDRLDICELREKKEFSAVFIYFFFFLSRSETNSQKF